MAQGYAGDVTPKKAWDILKTKDKSYLIDCRTTAEWNFVGVPDLSELNKEAALLEWTRFPDGSPNPHFVTQVEQTIPDRNATILFLCRSGQRSMGAAAATTEAGYPNCYNVLEGFEGNANHKNHRNSSDGWKFAGLPWQQS
jgi:rhodanese-related sulfurtransferase